ncbi:MAG: fused response regulator/phosphatase [Spirochaetes bacterium]|jgi:serine phosphatase RsbU (regulator of sigma subunit)/FixJ family two-component response regulator|nr:fused response regulator/phosphatase [Spirochaetota bacterium]
MAFAEPAGATVRLKVLALDDDGLVRRVLEDLLAEEHEFRAVATCAEFNAVVVGFNPDVLLLDLVLPDGNGLEICRELRKNGQFEKLFVLMLTASDQKQHVEQGYAAGANDYIRKPFVPFEVKSKISNCKKIISYQNKLYSAFNYQLEFSKRLYLLNRLIQTNVNVADIGELIREFESFNEIVDTGYLEVILIQDGAPSTLLRKSFDQDRVFLGYEQIREKTRLFDEKKLLMTSIKIRFGEKDLFCCIAPIAFNHSVSGFFVLQRDIPFDQEERNMITLCTDFMDIMLERLIAQKELARRYDLYREEIARVRTIQVSFLPDFKKIVGYDVASIFLPAEDISGDFFDGFFLDDEVYQFVLCDVSGHGVASSYIGNEIRMLFRTLSLRKLSPAFVIGAVNEMVSRDISGLNYFGTVVVCQLNIRTGEVLFSSGGHPPAILFRSGEAACTLLNKTGPLVGFFEKGDFKDTAFAMKSGDALLLYTDGVPETFSSDGRELFGEDRLVQVFFDSASLSSQDVMRTIVSSVNEFSGYGVQEDDITMICIKTN